MTNLQMIDPRDTLKMLRETLCLAQATMISSPEHRQRIQRMINEIDRQRPLGPDGKHGDRHTATCGCELPESDPRYLAPFMDGMRAARMAIVKRGWADNTTMTTADAVAVIDKERVECVKDLTGERGAS